MALKFSYQHAVATIRLHYEQAGFELGPGVPGQAVASEFGADVSEHRLGGLCALVDEAIFLLRYVSYYFVSAVVVQDKSGRAIAFLRLTTAMLSTISSIRLLCSKGFDTNARTQLRLLYEAAILWCRFLFDEESLARFISADTPKLANEFWHSTLARDKTEKFLDAKIEELGLSWIGHVSSGRHIASIREILGLTSHPSHIAVSFDAMHDWDKQHGSQQFAVRAMPNAAHFTLSASLFLMSLPFGFTPLYVYELKTSDVFVDIMIPQNRKAASWDEYCTEIRKMIGRLFVVSIHFSNGLGPGR